MKNILANWNFMRVLRLAIGIFIMVQGFQDKFWMLVVMGGLFSLLAVLNIGTCPMGSCATPTRKSSQKPEDIQYEEIK